MWKMYEPAITDQEIFRIECRLYSGEDPLHATREETQGLIKEIHRLRYVTDREALLLIKVGSGIAIVLSSIAAAVTYWIMR